MCVLSPQAIPSPPVEAEIVLKLKSIVLPSEIKSSLFEYSFFCLKSHYDNTISAQTSVLL